MILALRLYRTSSKFTGRLIARSGEKGDFPGVETQDIPDEPDVIDGGDGVDGIGGGGLATGSSSASGWRVV